MILHSHKRQHYYANNMLCQLGRGGGGSRQYQGMQFMYDCKILQLQSYVPTANRIIGQSQSTKIDANNVLPSFMMRLSSRIRQQRRAVPFASYQCQYNCYVVLHFHPQLYCLYHVPIKDLANEHLSTFTHDYIVRKNLHTNQRSCVWT